MLKRTLLCLALFIGIAAPPLVLDDDAIASDAGVTVDAAPAVIPPPPVEPAGSAAPVVVEPKAPAAAPADAPAEPEIATVTTLWKSGAFLPAIIVAVFLALSFASKRVSWLQKGTQAAVISALLTGCAVLVERAAAGTTPTLSMTLTALGAAVLLFLKPTPKPTPAAS